MSEREADFFTGKSMIIVLILHLKKEISQEQTRFMKNSWNKERMVPGGFQMKFALKATQSLQKED